MIARTESGVSDDVAGISAKVRYGVVSRLGALALDTVTRSVQPTTATANAARYSGVLIDTLHVMGVVVLHTRASRPESGSGNAILLSPLCRRLSDSLRCDDCHAEIARYAHC